MSIDARSEVVRKLGRLIEITRILDRNTEDASFARGTGAEILYIFDTNVVQMFLEPFRNPQHAEIFHSAVWGRNYAEYDMINEQSCLLAAEHLFSGSLPGQKHRRWYMSLPHYEELHIQIDWLEREISENIHKLRNDEIYQRRAVGFQERLQWVLSLNPQTHRDHFLELAQQHGASAADLRALEEAAGSAFEERAVAVRSREVCRLLARDKMFEPVDQLRRLRTRALFGAMRPIESAFKPDQAAMEIIEAEEARWNTALHTEIEARPRNSRTKTAIVSDSRTLAHLTWAMRAKVKSHQKIVLVTGDRALYDAYRRRHIQENSGLPFLLRPLSQYMPLFNPRAAESNVADREEAFSRVREAVEAATVALNLSLFGRNDQERENKTRARDYFILESEQPISSEPTPLMRSVVPGLYDDERIKVQNRNLSELVAPLQRVEKLMIGAFPALVALRIAKPEDRNDFLDAARRGDGAALSEALRTHLKQASDVAFMYSVPRMPEQVARLLALIGGSGAGLAMRARLSVRLSFPSSPNGSVEGSDEILLTRDEILQRLTDAPDLEALLQVLSARPSRIFAVAALLAFGVELWDQAARFAELAAAAAMQGDNANGQKTVREKDHFELLYMRATSLRFLMSSVVPDPQTAFADPWANWLRSAETDLTQCIAYHRRAGDLGREIRALSERASVRLAYCEWFAFGRLREFRVHADNQKDILKVLKRATRDLTECHRRYPKAQARVPMLTPIHSQQSDETLKFAKLQFSLNTAAAKLAAREIVESVGLPAEEVDAILAPLPTPSDWPRSTELHRMRLAYILASQGDDDGVLEIDVNELSLPLDIAVLAGLQRRARRAMTT